MLRLGRSLLCDFACYLNISIHLNICYNYYILYRVYCAVAVENMSVENGTNVWPVLLLPAAAVDRSYK